MDQKNQPIPGRHLPVAEHFRRELGVLTVLGGPIVVTQLLQMATVVLDTVMSGHASPVDLAGVSVGASIWVPVFLFPLGLVLALTPIVAHANGAGQYERVAPAVHQSFWISLVTSVITWVILQNMEPVLNLFKVNEEIRPVAAGYLGAIAFGIPALLCYNVLRAYADGLSLTWPAMITSVVGLLVNAPLNYILIYGKLGFPALGGVGCGWASAVAMWVSFIFMFVYVLRAPGFRKTWLFHRCHGPDWQRIKGQLALGLPIGLMYLVESSMFSVIALFLAVYGPMAVAAHQIALNVSSLVFMVPLSIGFAITIRVGFLLGVGAPQAARFSAGTGIVLTLIYGVCSGLGLWYFAAPIAALYTPEPEVQALTVELLVLAALFQLADSVQVTSAGGLRGYKDTKVPMAVMILSFWVVCLPLGYALGMTDWLGRTWSARGFWIGLVLGLTLAAVLLSARLHLISRRAIHAQGAGQLHQVQLS